MTDHPRHSRRPIHDHLPLKDAPLKKRIPLGAPAGPVEGILRDQKLRTVCEDAKCPNRHECYSHGTATFIILGKFCTRNCPYCAIPHGKPLAPDPQEPERLAEAAVKMRLRHVVITSVNRDDLPDGGAGHFARCIAELRHRLPATTIEVLTPDFLGDPTAIDIVIHARPEVYNHNIETVPRLFKPVRPGGVYQRSLGLLQRAAEAMNAQRHEKLASSTTPVIEQVKSGLMVGLGETRDEIGQVLHDLRRHGVTTVTVGQYLRPDPQSYPVAKYYTVPEFEHIRQEAVELGFERVFCGPFVRSSYHAAEVFLNTSVTAT